MAQQQEVDEERQSLGKNGIIKWVVIQGMSFSDVEDISQTAWNLHRTLLCYMPFKLFPTPEQTFENEFVFGLKNDINKG